MPFAGNAVKITGSDKGTKLLRAELNKQNKEKSTPASFLSEQ